MAALALVGTMTTGCSNEDLAKEAPQANNDNNTVTLTTTISLDGSASTRALDAQGKKTFAVGDSVAIFYQNTSGETQYADSKPLTASDITNNGKTAKFTVTLSNPKAEGQLRYIYPAAMANSDIAPNEEINDEYTFSTERIQNDQDGTLETLANKFDLAIFDGSLSSKALLPTTATLKNQLAIAELTIKNYAGDDITNDIKALKINQSKINQGETNELLYSYELTRPDNAAGPIYVAMMPSSGSTKDSITVTATTNDGTEYERDFKFNFAANNIYPLSVKTFKVVDISTLTVSEGHSLTYSASNGEMLKGKHPDSGFILIRIADGATVTLKNLTIDKSAYLFTAPGLSCLGDATIILEGKNKVKAFEDNSGIWVATNYSNNDYTLTITGDGSLEAIGGAYGAGIGSGKASCGNIVISGGTVIAEGGQYAAGIGSGERRDCGTITITSGVTKVTATKGENALHSIGKGSQSKCGTVTIGGTTGYISESPYTYPSE